MFKNKLNHHLWENWGPKQVLLLKLSAPSDHHGQWLIMASGKQWWRQGDHSSGSAKFSDIFLTLRDTLPHAVVTHVMQYNSDRTITMQHNVSQKHIIYEINSFPWSDFFPDTSVTFLLLLVNFVKFPYSCQNARHFQVFQGSGYPVNTEL